MLGKGLGALDKVSSQNFHLGANRLRGRKTSPLTSCTSSAGVVEVPPNQDSGVIASNTLADVYSAKVFLVVPCFSI